MRKIRTTTEKAEYLMTAHSKEWLRTSLGISIHTLYKRCYLSNWKASEIATIDLLYGKHKKGGDEGEY